MENQSAPSPKKKSSSFRSGFRECRWYFDALAGRRVLLDDRLSRGQVLARQIRAAVLSNDLSKLEVLLEVHNIQFPDTRDREERTALHHAVAAGNIAIVQALVEYGMKLDVLAFDSTSPLSIAVCNGNTAIIRLLLEHGAFKCCQACRGNPSPFHGSQIASPEIEGRHDSYDARGIRRYIDRCYLLHTAVRRGDETGLEIAKILVEYGAFLWIRDRSYSVALDLAYAAKWLAMCSCVIDRDKWQSVAHAASHNYIPAVWTLLEEGSDPNYSSETGVKYEGGDPSFEFAYARPHEGGELPPGLWWACCHGNLEMARLLLDHGADPRYRRLQSNLLHATISKPINENELKLSFYLRTRLASDEALPLLRILLPLVEDIDSKDQNGDTPLALAIKLDAKDYVKLLLEEAPYGANLNYRDSSGRSLFCHAKSLEVAQLLKNQGRSMTDRDSLGFTPFLASAEKGYVQVAEFLWQESSSKVECNNKGQNALHLAIEVSSGALVEFLTRKKMDVFKCDNDGNSSLDYALRINDSRTMKAIWWAALGQADPDTSLESLQSLCILRQHLGYEWGNFFNRVITPPYHDTDLRIPLLVDNSIVLGRKTWEMLLKSLKQLPKGLIYRHQEYEIFKFLRFLGIFTKVLHFEAADLQFRVWNDIRGKLSSIYESEHIDIFGKHAGHKKPKIDLLAKREIRAFFPKDFLDGGDLLRSHEIQRSSRTVKQFLDAGAPATAADGDGMTALHHAMAREDVPFKTVAELVASGANLAAVNRKGQKPVDCAVNWKNNKKHKALTHIEKSWSREEGGDTDAVVCCPDSWNVDSVLSAYNDCNPVTPSYSYSYSYSYGGDYGSSSGGYSGSYGNSGSYSGGYSGNSGYSGGNSTNYGGDGGGHGGGHGGHGGDSGGYGGGDGGGGGGGGGDGGGGDGGG